MTYTAGLSITVVQWWILQCIDAASPLLLTTKDIIQQYSDETDLRGPLYNINPVLKNVILQSGGCGQHSPPP